MVIHQEVCDCFFHPIVNCQPPDASEWLCTDVQPWVQRTVGDPDCYPFRLIGYFWQMNDLVLQKGMMVVHIKWWNCVASFCVVLLSWTSFLSRAFKCILNIQFQHAAFARCMLWLYSGAACTTYPQSQWVIPLSSRGARMISLVYVCFTNNLFIIAKCTYATPDPVQPDDQYLCAHCLYPLSC